MVDKKTSVIAVLCVVTVLFLGLWVKTSQKAFRLDGILGELEGDYDKLASVRTSLEENYSKLKTEKEDLETEYSVLKSEYDSLKNRSGVYSLSNFSREVQFTLDAGNYGLDEKTIEIDVGYGVIMEVYVKLVTNGEYESKIDLELSWRRGDQRGFLVGLGNAPAQTSKMVHGIAFCEIYDEDNDKIWIKVVGRITDYPWIEKDKITVFSKVT